MIAVNSPERNSTVTSCRAVHAGLARAVALAQTGGAGRGRPLGVRRGGAGLGGRAGGRGARRLSHVPTLGASGRSLPRADRHKQPSVAGLTPRGTAAAPVGWSASGPGSTAGNGGGVPPNDGHSAGGRTSRTAGWGWAGSPALRRPLDRRPQRQQLALGGQQVGLVGRVAQDLAVAEVHQLQQRRDDPGRPPQDQRVELHLEQRLALERLARRPPGLVVHHPHRAARGDVDPVDDPAQPQAAGQDHLDVLLTARGLEPPGVLQAEVAVQQGPGRRQPARDGRLVLEQRGEVGLLGQRAVPLRPQQRRRALHGPLRGRQVEQALQDGVHQRAAGGGRGRLLRQPVDRPEAVEQRAGHEVAGPRGRQRTEDGEVDVDGGHVGDGTSGL